MPGARTSSSPPCTAEKKSSPPVTRPSRGDDLDACLTGVIDGFTQVRNALDREPDAISFAFPGPADFPSGIIGDLRNLPAFRGGVALGPMLEDHFEIPVFINNDGDLFTYGEAVATVQGRPSVNVPASTLSTISRTRPSPRRR